MTTPRRVIQNSLGLLAVILFSFLTQRSVAADAAPEAANPIVFRGRGVNYVPGRVISPLQAGSGKPIGSRPADATNRIVIDDAATTVTIDRTSHRILFESASTDQSRHPIGEVMLLGWGTTKKGDRVPFGVHLKIAKKRGRFVSEIHPHPTTRERITVTEIEPFTVSVRETGGTPLVIMTVAQAKKAIEEPEMTARLANIAIQVTDHLDGKRINPAGKGERLVDLSVGFGAKKLHLDVARIELVSLEASNAPLIRNGSIASMMSEGVWEMRITSESRMLPKSEFERDLFLYGMEGIPILEPLVRRGLKKGETLAIGFRAGHGYVRFDRKTAVLENAVDVARAYLEFHFIGGVVARQVAELHGRLEKHSAKP